MDHHRLIPRLACALLLAGAAALLVAACVDDGPSPVAAGSAADAATDQPAADADAREPDGGDGGAVDPVEAGCVDDFDAAPPTCLPDEKVFRQCPPRPGFCGSDGRTYCSATSAVDAGVAVVLSAACEMPCGTRLLPDGGRPVCQTLTEFCFVKYDIGQDNSYCGRFDQVGCGASHSCACVMDAGVGRGCRESHGAIYVDKPGAVTARAAAPLE